MEKSGWGSQALTRDSIDDGGEIQVAVVMRQEACIQSLLQLEPQSNTPEPFTSEQRKDLHVRKITEQGELPQDPAGRARKVAMQGPLFTMMDGVLFYLDPKNNEQQRVVVPENMCRRGDGGEPRRSHGGGGMGAILWQPTI